MDKRDYGKTAICGVNGDEVTVSKYNFKCPCLNCADCKNEETKCQWKYVLQTSPCTDDDIKNIVCKNCIATTRAHEGQQQR